MILYVYKLDDYYCGTQKYYSLFESLFLYNDLNKEESLEKLGINYNTYRGEKRKEFVSNKNPSKLFSYFNYSVLDEEDKITEDLKEILRVKKLQNMYNASKDAEDTVEEY